MRPLEDELAGQMLWLRRLAMALAGDSATADDLVQDTCVAALRAQPKLDGTARPWLATVVRNMSRSRARTTRRRHEREQAVGEGDALLPSPEQLALRYEAYRLLTEAVSHLAEPYRSTVLLCYGEGIPPTEIAHRTGLPPGTVRRRLKVGLDQIRERLDDRYDGDRRAWLLLLVPRPHLRAPAPAAAGASAGLATLLVAAAVVVAVLLLGPPRARAPRAAMLLPGPRASVGWKLPRPSAPGRSLPSWLSQPGVGDRRVAGRVTFEGRPVAGARVLLVHELGTRGVPAGVELISGADGRFDFGAQPPAHYFVAAATPELTMEDVNVDLRDPLAPRVPDALELALAACANLVTGRIADAARIPIPHARVRLYRLLGTESAADGSYRLCVPPGQVELRVEAAGYGTVEVVLTAAARIPLDVTLLPQVSVSGVVLGGDHGEPSPVAGAIVVGRPSRASLDRHAATVSAQADAEGRFRLTGLEPGRWLFSASGPGLASEGGVEPVLVGSGSEGAVTLRLAPRRRVAGRVLEGGQPVAGVVVRALPATPASPVVEDAVTQTDGGFVLPQVGPGPLQFSVEGFEVLDPPRLASRGGEQTVALRVRRSGSVRGRVLRDGAAVPSTVVLLQGPDLHDEAWTLADGRYDFTGLAPGRYRLSAQSDRTGAASRVRELLIERGAQLAGIDFDLDLRGEIAGTVVDQAGRPVPLAWIQLSSPDAAAPPVPCRAGGDGRFACRMLARGSYRPAVLLFGHPATSLPASQDPFPMVELPGDSARIAGLTLAVRFERLAIAGRVVDDAGLPIADARVEAAPLEGASGSPFGVHQDRPSFVTDVDGRFTLGPLAAGAWAVRARTPAGAELVLPRVSAGARDLRVVVQRPSAPTAPGVAGGSTR